MNPSYWQSPLVFVLWQTVLHSAVAAAVFVVWSRHLDLPSGRARRWFLSVLLVLPIVTALIPGREGMAFREQVAWLDSSRILAIPIWQGFRVYHVALLAALASAIASIWQEVVPALRAPSPDFEAAPENLSSEVQALPGWEHCTPGILPDPEVVLATGGWPSAPHVMLSRGALEAFDGAEREAVLRHENAHWRRGRWFVSHVLFGFRILKFYNPVALWAFREYSIEVEIDCDADAVADSDPKPLARALLKVYETTGRRDLSARSTLRTRVDILLGKIRVENEHVATGTVLLATLVLALVLPWIV